MMMIENHWLLLLLLLMRCRIFRAPYFWFVRRNEKGICCCRFCCFECLVVERIAAICDAIISGCTWRGKAALRNQSDWQKHFLCYLVPQDWVVCSFVCLLVFDLLVVLQTSKSYFAQGGNNNEASISIKINGIDMRSKGPHHAEGETSGLALFLRWEENCGGMICLAAGFPVVVCAAGERRRLLSPRARPCTPFDFVGSQH